MYYSVLRGIRCRSTRLAEAGLLEQGRRPLVLVVSAKADVIGAQPRALRGLPVAVEVPSHGTHLPNVREAPVGQFVDRVRLRLLPEVGRRWFPADSRDHPVERGVDVPIGCD